MKPQEFGKQFVLVSRQLAWAESPSEWEPAVKSMHRFLDKIEKSIVSQKIDKTWSDLELARLFAILLTILAETGQYRHEAFVPNPEKDKAATIIDIDKQMFRVTPGFTIGSLIIVGILAALYTVFW